MEKIIFILGASGSGKTTTVENIESENPDKYFFAYFDQPKVPSEEEIKKEYKDWENWGIQRTNEWFNKIKNKSKNRVTIFDIQTKPTNIENACKKFDVTDYAIIILDCSDDERKKRLIERGQPYLINDSLLDWAQFLRNEANDNDYIIIDNTELTKKEGFQKVKEVLKVIKVD
jgi:dephospho-CoA kinase